MKFLIQLPAQSAGANTLYSVVHSADFDTTPGLQDPDTAYDIYVDYLSAVAEGRHSGLLPDPESLTAVIVIGIDSTFEEEGLYTRILSQHNSAAVDAFGGNHGITLGSASFLGVDSTWFLTISMTQADLDAHIQANADAGAPEEVLSTMFFSSHTAVALAGLSIFEKGLDPDRATWGRRVAEQLFHGDVFAVWAEHINNAFSITDALAPIMVDTYEMVEAAL